MNYTDTFIAAILEYYKTHANGPTAAHFHIGVQTLKHILHINNVSEHSKTAIKELRLTTLKQNNLDKYGVENVSQIPAIKQIKSEKLKQAHTAGKYKSSYSNISNTKTKLKIKATILQRYGVTNISKLPSIKQKKKETLFKHFGSCTFNNREKAKQTCLLKYGVENPQQVKEINEQAVKSCATTKIINNTLSTSRMYNYNGLQFDSLYEVVYFIYMKENGYNIVRNNTYYIPYEFAGKIYYYIPDFIINNTILVEVKGEHLIDNYGVLIPICSKNITDQAYSYQMGKYRAKYNCMVSNNIKLVSTKKIGLWEDTINTAFTYVINKYGESYRQKLDIQKCIKENNIYPINLGYESKGDY